MISRCARGVALLEVLVALVIVVVAGAATYEELEARIRYRRELLVLEQQVEAAAAILAKLSLYGRRELEQRVGAHPFGGLAATISRPEPDLFRAAVAARTATTSELLVTVLYRPRVQGSAE